jgi:hypothetical protein
LGAAAGTAERADFSYLVTRFIKKLWTVPGAGSHFFGRCEPFDVDSTDPPTEFDGSPHRIRRIPPPNSTDGRRSFADVFDHISTHRATLRQLPAESRHLVSAAVHSALDH